MTAGAIDRAASLGRAVAERAYSDGFRRKMLILLFVTWLLPIQPELAGQRLDPYRLVMVVMYFPFLAAILSGKAGRVLVSDWFILAFGGWMVLTFVLHNGMSQFAFGASLAIEVFGGYAAGRLLIRNLDDFRRYIRYTLVALVVLLPFVVIELLTGRMLVSEFLGKFLPATEKFPESRYGLSRVQGGFPHSILYGLFCSINAGTVMYAYRGRLMRVVPRLGLVILMSFASLSSAPILAIMIQAATYMWGVVTRNRWKQLVWLVIGMIVFLEVASNRGPAIILIETLTLEPQTGWWRYFIWVHVIENVKAHPILGIGMNNWVRPYWMFAASVDSYWLVVALRHGLTGLGLLLGSFVLHIALVVRAKDLTAEARDLRAGYMISMVGMIFTLTTVHVWGILGVIVMFFLGAGSFFYTSASVTNAAQANGDSPPQVPQPPGQRQRVVYSRNLPRREKAPNSRFTR